MVPPKAGQNTEWVDSPIRAHPKLTLSYADQNNKRVESPICTQGVGSNANQSKQWVESPISAYHTGPNKLALSPFLDSKTNQTPTLKSILKPTSMAGQNKEWVESPIRGCNNEVTTTELHVAPSFVPALLNPGNDEVEHAQQETVTWFCVNVTNSAGAVLRRTPHFQAPRTGTTLLKNEVFSVKQEIASPVDVDGRIYLELSDGRGWAFDDSALVPESPSVVRLGVDPVNNSVMQYDQAALQYGQQPELVPVLTENANTSYPEPMTASCFNCNCQMDVNAKFCIICGERQPSPPGSLVVPGAQPGITTPACQAWVPYYQYMYQCHYPVFEVPGWEPSASTY
jgi:hypothetical protein